MSIFSNAILQQVYEKLTGNANLMVLVTGVFDHVPEDQDYPFVAIGELVETEDNTDDPQQGVRASLTIHSYSREWGRKKINDIQEQINQALHRVALVSAGFNFISIDQEQSQSFTDSDGNTRHGVVEFNIIIEEV